MFFFNVFLLKAYERPTRLETSRLRTYSKVLKATTSSDDNSAEIYEKLPTCAYRVWNPAKPLDVAPDTESHKVHNLLETTIVHMEQAKGDK